MSRAVFARERPKYMKPIQWATRRQCLCARHQNAALKLKAVKINTSPNIFIRNNSDEDIARLMQTIPDYVRYSEWKTEDINYGGKLVKKIRLKQLELPKTKFASLFKEEFSLFRNHVKRIQSQYCEIDTLRKSLIPMEEVTIQMDYSENYSCAYQDEPSAMYYTRQQVTIHPMVVHYRNIEGDMEHKSFVGISGDTNHSAPTCVAFLKKLIPQLQEMLPNLTTVHYVTDSPASQYRNKSIVHLLSIHSRLFPGVKAHWNFLESGHGKGACDGVGGSVKKTADIHVKSGSIIGSAEDFFNWGVRIVTKISFIFITTADIKAAERHLRKAKYVKGISDIHSLRVEDSKVFMRETSCYKECCRHKISCPDWSDTAVKVDLNIFEDVENRSDQAQLIPEEEQIIFEEEEVVPQEDQNQYVEPKFPVGGMVKARYQGRVYFGKISEFVQNEYHIYFMVKTPGGVYKWPEVDDDLWMPEKSIVEQVTLDESGKVISKKNKKIEKVSTEIVQEANLDVNVSKFPVGGMVKARYQGRVYVGKISEFLGNEYHIYFMVKTPGGVYKWPEVDDDLWMPEKSIIEEVTLNKDGKLCKDTK
jgi:hypothetical protein